MRSGGAAQKIMKRREVLKGRCPQMACSHQSLATSHSIYIL